MRCDCSSERKFALSCNSFPARVTFRHRLAAPVSYAICFILSRSSASLGSNDCKFSPQGTKLQK